MYYNTSHEFKPRVGDVVGLKHGGDMFIVVEVFFFKPTGNIKSFFKCELKTIRLKAFNALMISKYKKMFRFTKSTSYRLFRHMNIEQVMLVNI